MKLTNLLFPALIFITAHNLYAQIEINGLIDFEFSRGGEDSEFSVNDITSEYKDPHLAINQINFFIFSQITENWYINSRLQFDTWGTGELNPLRISLAELVWEPFDKPVRMSVGRFLSPFGLYPQRQLSTQNNFINTPMAYGYGLNMTSSQGYVFNYDSSFVSEAEYGYGYGNGRLTTISYAGYTTGIQFSWLIVPEVLNLDLALANTAPASQRPYTNLSNFGGIARLTFRPAIFWTQGISAAHGGFMAEDAAVTGLDKPESYSQTLIGTDWIIAYNFLELSGEFIFSRWNVPGYQDSGFILDSYDNPKELTLDNYSYYLDLKYEPSFLSGSYLALRFEELSFLEFNEGSDYYSREEGLQFDWGKDIRRYSIALGYKLSNDIQFKIAYSDQEYTSGGWSPEAYTIRSMLSAGF